LSLVDANVLIYAVDRRARDHAAARDWLATQLNGSRRVGIPWWSLGAFLRIMTHPRASARPLTSDEAWRCVTAWLASPVAWVPEPGPRYAEVLGELLARREVRGNLVPDAMLAALAIEHGLTVYSADADFALFDGLRWEDPLR
jgi:uncharacterized protein